VRTFARRYPMARMVFCMGIMITIIFVIVGMGHADIIKLKRGISFEGKIIDETDTSYIAELDVGVIEFKKNEVEEIEQYSEIDNVKMIQEWKGDVPAVSSESSDDASLFDEEALAKAEQEHERNKLIKYKGRYITSEIYEIIQKERTIQERRYKFLQEKRRLKESHAEHEAHVKAIGDEQKEKTAPLKTSTAEAIQTKFGEKDSSALGSHERVKAAPSDGQRDRLQRPFTGRKFDPVAIEEMNSI